MVRRTSSSIRPSPPGAAGARCVGRITCSSRSAADRTSGGLDRLVTDNGYLIWLFELGWLGVVSIALLSVLTLSALIAARAWWALLVLLIIAGSNALFAASDSRVDRSTSVSRAQGPAASRRSARCRPSAWK